jgi:hypothetical protein
MSSRRTTGKRLRFGFVRFLARCLAVAVVGFVVYYVAMSLRFEYGSGPKTRTYVVASGTQSATVITSDGYGIIEIAGQEIWSESGLTIVSAEWSESGRELMVLARWSDGLPLPERRRVTTPSGITLAINISNHER